MRDLKELSAQLVYKGILFPIGICRKQELDRLQKSFTFDDTDIIIAAYPKSGQSWLIEMVDLIMNNGNVKKIKNVPQVIRAPYLETAFENRVTLDIIEKRQPPRIIKTHLPYSLLEPSVRNRKTKIIVIMRNPKDTLVSYYHFYRMNQALGKFKGTWDEFYELFKKKQLIYGDWFDFQDLYWSLRDQPNVFFVKYENMIENLTEVIYKVAQFLGKHLDRETVSSIASHGTFANMKLNSPMKNKLLDTSVGQFMRKGVIGDWKNYFSLIQSTEVDVMFAQKLAGKGLHFKYDSNADEDQFLVSKL